MKIVFFGTPQFAVASLDKICSSGQEVVTVVTTPDKEKGRGLKVSSSDVKKYALEKNIPLLQPEKLKDENFISQLKNINADLFIVVAYRILPEEVFNLPKYGSFNLHASLLPKFRGAAPIQWALINGEKVTGVTTFKLESKVDTGNIYLQKECTIEDEDNFMTLHDKLKLLGAELVIETINMIESNTFELKSQNHIQATSAPKIVKETCLINWSEPAQKIHNLVRGLSPFPGAFFMNEGRVFKVYKSLVINNDKKIPVGEFFQTKENLIIGCGEDALSILEIQQEGRKRMTIEEFLRGYSFK